MDPVGSPEVLEMQDGGRQQKPCRAVGSRQRHDHWKHLSAGWFEVVSTLSILIATIVIAINIVVCIFSC